MAEIDYTHLNTYFSGLRKSGKHRDFAPVYLFYGEEFLYKAALETLITELLPPAQKRLNYDPIEGTNENIQTALERVNTFSLLSGTKVVALLNSQAFYSKQNETSLFEKAKEAHDNNDLKKAAGYFLGGLGILNLDLDDIDPTDKTHFLKINGAGEQDTTWIEATISYCRQNGLVVSPAQNTGPMLCNAIEKGFPDNNHLIITAEIVDKRQRLYKIIKEKGVIIDCSVPKGELRADKEAQEVILRDRMKTVLTESGKTMDQKAYTALIEMTGFDLRTFSNNLEKLIHYVGDRNAITKADVETALERTKKDPIFELTNAVSDRNANDALFYLNSLLSENTHPLQALAAIINAMRRLLVIKSFIKSPEGKIWTAGCQYARFRSAVMPVIQSHDRRLTEQLQIWENALSVPDEKNAPQLSKKKTGRKKVSTDLLIAKNPNNPYPVFQTFLKSEKFTLNELIRGLVYLSDADKRIKSTGQNPRLVLEETIIRLCLVQNETKKE